MTDKEKIKEEVEDIKRTLLARIIPSLPITPNTNDGKDRERVKDIINRFEFEDYFWLRTKAIFDDIWENVNPKYKNEITDWELWDEMKELKKKHCD